MLRPNYRGSAGYGNAFYRDVVGDYFNNMHLDVHGAASMRLIAARHRRSRSAGRDGLERRRHLVNKLITMTDRFKAASSGAGVANWISLYAQTDTRSFRAHVVRRHAVAEERADRSVLEQLAAQGRREREDADAVLRRRERHARAVGAVGRDVSRAQEPRRADAAASRRRAKGTWGELRHLIFKANTELEWFEKYAKRPQLRLGEGAAAVASPAGRQEL